MTNPYDTKPIWLTDNIGLPGNPSFTDYRLYAADLRWNFKSLPDELAKPETKDMPDKPTIPSHPSDAAKYIMENLPNGVVYILDDHGMSRGEFSEYLDAMLTQYHDLVYNEGYEEGRDDEREYLRFDGIASDRGYID